MSDPQFRVHLGGGLYIDSTGVLTRSVDPSKPVYSTPGGGFPINLDALEKALAGINKALPDSSDPKSRQKFDKILGSMRPEDKENLLKTLGAIGAIAGTIASVVPFVGAAVAIFSLFGFFKEGPSPLELLVNRRFDDLERRVKALEIQIQQKDLRTRKSTISAALAAVSNYITELKNTPPDATTLALRKQEMRSILHGTGIAVRDLLNSATWLSGFDRQEHKFVWYWLENRLFTFPDDGPRKVALMPQEGSNAFDHRIMVPLVSFAVESYLTLLRTLTPEFRSTRESREDLIDYARDLEVLVRNMREHVLGRTFHQPSDFVNWNGLPLGLSPAEVVDHSSLGLPAYISPACTRFVVGALDLRDHNDGFFTPGFTAGGIQLPGSEYGRQGLLNVRWIPPAKLERYEEAIPTVGPEIPNSPQPTRTLYRITNPEECAAAANAQAELDYADLLYSSGYLNLVHLIATLRNEATDPDRSQTVHSKAFFHRKAGPLVPVQVKSGPILMNEEIVSVAEEQSQQFEGTVYFSTQPVDRDRPLGYQIYLRTLRVVHSSPALWSEQTYPEYYSVRYMDDAANPGFKKLIASSGVALDEVKIAEGVSTRESRHFTGKARLKAVTFDWWIPVKYPSHLGSDSRGFANIAVLRSLGWDATLRQTRRTLRDGLDLGRNGVPAGVDAEPAPGSDPPDAVMPTDGPIALGSMGWHESIAPENGQHRMASETTIEIDYSLDWQGDRLMVILNNNRAADRNYALYVVIEEKLGSGQVLHTVERTDVTGQMTLVPQTFFDAENEAYARAARSLREYARRYVTSVQDLPHPGDPDYPRYAGLFGLDPTIIAGDPLLRDLHLGTFSSLRSMEEFMGAAVRHTPAADLLRQFMRQSGSSEATIESTFRTYRDRV